ncbi:Meckel syndrome type 1 protein [Melipona quadrifasciata]|uniref:Meckel syndrome type 1 protein n=1 Tax=Melipona quadrifasciata TaxID=166423 RepID=A0A0M8ZV74_9HYME|nr:Meckel syndrome type 1 protein [Melipona quadrifasciata]
MANKIRKQKIAVNYKVKEPISNFKIRVKIVQQRPLLAELLENEGDTRDSNFLEEEDRIFGWQEKVFSPFEVSFYSEETNCLTECQKVYYRQIKERSIEGSQLYTHTQNDSYYLGDELLTKRYKTKLAIKNQTALPALQNRKPFPERHNKTVVDDVPDETRIRTNHYLYMERSTMYVMVDLSQRDKVLTSTDEDTEVVLLAITYNGLNKILTVDPDFTDDHCYTITNSSEHWSTSQIDRLFGRTQRCNLKNNSAYFSYATEISLDFQSTVMLDANTILLSWPRLLLSVTSLDSWFRYRTEGYAMIPLPVLPGLYKFNVPTWRPTGSIINTLRRFFTGSTYELEDITYCSIPKGYENKMLNKSHLNVTSSGYIKLIMNIIHQTRSSIKHGDQLDYFQRLSTDKLMTNIDNIFEQFKAARERMLQIRNLNI